MTTDATKIILDHDVQRYRSGQGHVWQRRAWQTLKARDLRDMSYETVESLAAWILDDAPWPGEEAVIGGQRYRLEPRPRTDGVFDPYDSARENIAGLIRANHSGMCSGEPAGIRYPEVPSVEDVTDKLGIDPDGPMTEDQWDAACDVLGIE